MRGGCGAVVGGLSGEARSGAVMCEGEDEGGRGRR